MTERKPPDATIESWVEFQIRRAQERGEFDDLRGAGRPIEDLYEPHDELWWVRRKLRDEHVTVTPPALAIRREREQAREAVRRAATEAEVRDIVVRLNRRIVKVNATVTTGPATSVAPLDVERVVEEWRAGRQ